MKWFVQDFHKTFWGAIFLCVALLATGGCAASHSQKAPGQGYGEVFFAQTANPRAPESKAHVQYLPGEIAENIYSTIKDSKSFSEQLGDFIVGNANN